MRDRMPMQPARFMTDLAERIAGLDQPALIFDEALTSAPDLLRYLPQEEPGTWFQTRVGMLGTGLPGTVGLKLAYPGRTVFGFAGDGGAMSTIQALATAARYGIGAKFVVCNNKSYRILKYNLQQYWRDRADAGERPAQPNQAFPDSFDLAPPDLRFDTLAQGQGVDAVRVERPPKSRPHSTARSPTTSRSCRFGAERRALTTVSRAGLEQYKFDIGSTNLLPSSPAKAGDPVNTNAPGDYWMPRLRGA